SIAKVLKMQTIAEYVEDVSTIEILRELGVNYAQGFGIGRPEPAENWTENRSNLYI
ncbi:MAG: EAL domain-containing protein, partial [Gammaproteobacteria bacterium]|nr:EAL domain-containing protein [Gammaproteobacteria bacterium]